MQRLTELLGCRGLDVLLGIAIAVADDILTDKDDENITPTDLARTRIALSDTVNALTDIEGRLYRTPKLTQEQKCEKLGALLSTAVEATIATRDGMTEDDLAKARLMVQEAIDELRAKYT